MKRKEEEEEDASKKKLKVFYRVCCLRLLSTDRRQRGVFYFVSVHLTVGGDWGIELYGADEFVSVIKNWKKICCKKAFIWQRKWQCLVLEIEVKVNHVYNGHNREFPDFGSDSIGRFGFNDMIYMYLLLIK